MNKDNLIVSKSPPLDILLIDPPYMSLKGSRRGFGYNLGLTCIAAYLRKEGLTARIISGDILYDSYIFYMHKYLKSYVQGKISLPSYSTDKAYTYRQILEDDNHIVWRKIRTIIREHYPLAVGISYLSPAEHVVKKIAKLTKSIDKGIKVIVGGHHPTHCCSEIMEDKEIDFVIRGEGETPLLSLMRELKSKHPDLNTVPGILWRRDDATVITNPNALQIQDLDTLPFPARDAVIGLDYKKFPFHRLSTTRGCLYQCNFCADKALWHGKIRQRSVENVIEEMLMLKKSCPKIKNLFFNDGTFTFNRPFVIKLCKKMIEDHIGLVWGCSARYDNIDLELLSVMKKAGCTLLYLGVESGSEGILNAMRKNIRVSAIIQKTDQIRRSGITTVVSVLFGIPGETRDDMEKTLSLMKKLKVDYFDVNSYVPLPGTILYDKVIGEQKKKVDWLKTSFSSGTCFNDAVSPQILRDTLLKAYAIGRKRRIRSMLRLVFKPA